MVENRGTQNSTSGNGSIAHMTQEELTQTLTELEAERTALTAKLTQLLSHEELNRVESDLATNRDLTRALMGELQRMQPGTLAAQRVPPPDKGKGPSAAEDEVNEDDDNDGYNSDDPQSILRAVGFQKDVDVCKTLQILVSGNCLGPQAKKYIASLMRQSVEPDVPRRGDVPPPTAGSSSRTVDAGRTPGWVPINRGGVVKPSLVPSGDPRRIPVINLTEDDPLLAMAGRTPEVSRLLARVNKRSLPDDDDVMPELLDDNDLDDDDMEPLPKRRKTDRDRSVEDYKRALEFFKLQMTPYDEGEDFLDWITSFINIMEQTYPQLDDFKKASVLETLLPTTVARRCRMWRESKTKFGTILSYLMDYYDDKSVDADYKYEQRVMKHDESVREYYWDLNDLAKRCKIDVHSFRFARKFRQGLLPQYAEFMALFNPTSTLDTLKAACNAENTLRERRTVSASQSKKSEPKPLTVNSPRQNSNHNRFERSARRFPPAGPSNSSSGSATMDQEQATLSKLASSKDSRFEKRVIVCHHCGKEGHIRPACPDRKDRKAAMLSLEEVTSDREYGGFLTIGGRLMECLFDTGADISLITEDLVPMVVHPMDRVEPRVLSVTGERVGCCGLTTLNVSFGTPDGESVFHTFRVVPKSEGSDVLILGADFIKKSFTATNHSESYFTTLLGNVVYFGPRACFTENIPLQLLEPLQLEPGDKVEVEVCPKYYLPDVWYEVKGNRQVPTLEASDVHLDSGEYGTYSVVLRNNDSIRMDLPAHFIVATLARSDSTSVEGFEEEGDLASMSNTLHYVQMTLDDCPGLSYDQLDQLNEVAMEFQDCFLIGPFIANASVEVFHDIRLSTNAPIKCAPYRTSRPEAEVIRTEVNKMLEAGVVSPSKSPYGFPVVIAPKPDGTPRFCTDFRKLNAITEKDAYPMPRIDDTLEQLSGNRFFSTMDLKCGFWQVPLREADKPKTSFVTPFGQYQYNVMPFGLCNAPATFQRLMTEVLGEHLYDCCLVYIDDIIVYSKTWEEHLDHLRMILESLREARLRLAGSKCTFGRASVNFLGHVVSEEGISTNPDKQRAIVEYPRPLSVSDVRSMLGLFGYYRRFIQGYASIARPLTNLTKKDHPFVWNQDCEDAFVALKKALSTAPVLAYPDFSRPFVLHTDASTVGLGALLCQAYDGKERIVQCASRALADSERNYTVSELECLALIYAIEKFHPYLHGDRFRVYTDHAALQFLQTSKISTGRLARWKLILQQYDMEIVHRSGKHNSDADALSRHPLPLSEGGPQRIEEGGPSSVTGDSDHSFWDSVPSAFNVNSVTVKTLLGLDLEVIRKEQERDWEIQALIEWLENGMVDSKNEHIIGLISTFGSQLLLNDDILYCARVSGKKRVVEAIYIPKSLRGEALKVAHDGLEGGHFGFVRTYQKVQECFFWPRMASDTAAWCRSCLKCQGRNSPRMPLNGLMGSYPLEVGRPMGQISVDHAVKFPKTANGNEHILVVTCRLTKFVEAFPVKDLTAATTANILAKQIFCRYGAPYSILSDNGGAFVSELTAELYQLYSIKQIVTNPYHPSGNGQTERMNHTIKNYLAKFVNSQRNNWDELLPFFCMAYNSSIHRTTLETPFFLMFGRDPRTLMDAVLNVWDHSQTIKERRNSVFSELMPLWESTRKLIVKSHDASKLIHDKHRRDVEFSVGDRVWVDVRSSDKSKSAKIGPHWTGPFRIVEKLSPITYRVVSMRGRDCEHVLHIERLKPFTDRNPRITSDDVSPEFHRLLNEDLDAVAGIYKVKRVLQARSSGTGSSRKFEYLVEWDGYPGEDSWVSDANILDRDMLVEFYRLQQTRPSVTEVGGVRSRRREPSQSIV